MIEQILNLIRKHEKWRGHQCLNLIPSENIMSKSVRQILSSEFGNRYTARDRFYMGTRFLDEIEEYGEKLAKEVFNAKAADLRPLSGHIADLIFMASFSKPSDRLMCVSPKDGGYPGMWKNGLIRLLNLHGTAFPFSQHDMNIKVEEAKRALKRIKPKIVVFGASKIVFPHPVKELGELAKQHGAVVGFDGSHVMGLIAGGEFQDPLKEGACALFGSTHKTFFGPQGGIILADKEHGEALKKRIYPAFVDNAHWNRIAALTLALAEMKEFGKPYAKQVIRNSQTLAKALYDHGLPVACEHLGFTKSHMVLLDYRDGESGRANAHKLERANIIVDCSLRIGTCEVTRRGMKETEMGIIAELIKRVLVDEEKPEKTKRDVLKVCSEFQHVEYSFDE